MKIGLAADHAGFKKKEILKVFLQKRGDAVTDFGPQMLDEADDYPDFMAPAAQAVARGDVERAIILGGSGQGEAMVANRVRGVRAAVFYGGGREPLRLSREHNDANVLALGARFIGDEQLEEIVSIWLDTSFSGDERHVRRIKKIDNNNG